MEKEAKKELSKRDFDIIEEALLTLISLAHNNVAKFGRNFGPASEITQQEITTLNAARDLREQFRAAHTAWIEYD